MTAHPSSSGPTPSGPSFITKTLIVAAAVSLLVLTWLLADVFILVFGSIVLGAALHGMACQMHRRLKVPRKLSVAVTLLVVIAVLGMVGWFIGDALAEQMVSIRERLPQALRQLQQWLAQMPMGRQILDMVQDLREAGLTFPELASAAGLTLGALGSALLTLILAVYLAADPGLYVGGLVKLVPPSRRPPVARALRESGRGLTRWLVGQGISMAFLGVTTMIGLFAIQAPLALALGLITALLCFVPFFGAVAAGVISVLVAFTAGPDTALYVAILFLAIQQLEEYLVTPFVQRWAVALPPAMTLVSTLVFGILFGPLGVVFATPLMVVVMILVNRLYVPALEAADRQRAQRAG